MDTSTTSHFSDNQAKLDQGRYLSPEAQKLLKDGSFTIQQVLDFVRDTGLVGCTDYCCGATKPNREPSEYGPNLDPALTPKCVNDRTKLAQWNIWQPYLCALPPMNIIRYSPEDSMVIVSEYRKTQQRMAFNQTLTNSHDGVLSGSSLGHSWHHQLLGPEFAQLLRIRDEKRVTEEVFAEKVFCQKSPSVVADCVFWSIPHDGLDEIALGYLAWRKIWHTFIFRDNVEEPSWRMTLARTLVRSELPKLHMWGNLQQDYNLYHMQELSAKDMRYTYEMDAYILRHILEHLAVWREECETLNAYVGLRRHLTREGFHEAKRAAQMAGTAIERLLKVETNPAMMATNDGVHRRDRLNRDARNKFAGLRQLLCQLTSPVGSPHSATSSSLATAGSWVIPTPTTTSGSSSSFGGVFL